MNDISAPRDRWLKVQMPSWNFPYHPPGYNMDGDDRIGYIKSTKLFKTTASFSRNIGQGFPIFMSELCGVYVTSSNTITHYSIKKAKPLRRIWVYLNKSKYGIT